MDTVTPFSIGGDTMAKYGAAAQLAAEIMNEDRVEQPREAWAFAVRRVFPNSLSSQRKSCPRDAFLALCQAGAVQGVPAGAYTKSIRNREYAIRALHALRADPGLINDPAGLWRRATGGEGTRHNSQREVVRALWLAGQIR